MVLGQHPGEDFYGHRANYGTLDSNLHSILSPAQGENNNGEARQQEEPPKGTTSTAVPSTETSSTANIERTWGERDVGEPVSHRMAMEDYQVMRRRLTNLSRSQSSRDETPRLTRTVTSSSSKLGRATAPRTRSFRGAPSVTTDDDDDIEAGDVEGIAEIEPDFELGPFIKEGHFEKRTDTGASAKKVGVIYKNLTVKGAGSTANSAKTLPDAILGTSGRTYIT